MVLADTVGRHFPNLVVLSARARNRRHAHQLMDRHVDGIVRETFFSSLRLSELAMEEALGVPAEEAERAIRSLRQHDEHQSGPATRSIWHEIRLIQSAREAAQELADLLEA